MVNNIKILSQTLQHKIAAGEVIERPASVLKELIENAIDARATRIEVDLLGGGLDRIIVFDNGTGMSRDDAKLAFARYSTSKLTSEEDLFQIGTLGFRGEALASIAAVSEVELETKTKDEMVGTKIIIRGGQIESIEDCGCSIGTKITVSKLFFNVPARKKYLKSVLTENRHCTQATSHQALIYPQIGFKLSSNSKVYYDTYPTDDHQQRIAEVLDSSWLKDILSIKYKAEPLTISGFIGKPSQATESRRHQYLYVNQRHVSDYLVGYRIKKAFHTLLDKNLHPVFVLNITLPPDQVDVNVHPRKAEVKFSNPNQIYKNIEEATILALRNENLIPAAEFVKEQSTETNYGQKKGNRPPPVLDSHDFARWDRREQRKQDFQHISQAFPGQRQEQSQEESSIPVPSPAKLPLVRDFQPIAQLYSTYILARDDDYLYLIDQHAAQERTMYEHLLNAASKKEKIQTQLLLVPATIELDWAAFQALSTMQDLLRRVGIDIDEFGNQDVIVRSVPAILADSNIEKLLKTLADQLIDEYKGQKITQAIEDKLIMRACKISVKANEKLNSEQMQKIIDDLLKCEVPYTCPHGRPTIVRLDKYELEKIFKRA